MNFIEESNRIYCKDSQGKVIAEVTFPDIRYHVVNLDHTFVDDSLRGQGIAGKLMENVFEGMILTPDPMIAIGAFLFSVVLGILFGMFPAIKASGLQPVEALRAD